MEIDNSKLEWRYLKRALKNIVEYHLAIISVAESLENMFSTLLLLIFVSTLVVLALLVFRISTVTNFCALDITITVPNVVIFTAHFER